jgi:hypothetical protein
LHIGSLAAKRRPGDVRSALSLLPKELDETYDEVIDRIWSQNEYLSIAKQVLGWITNAKRPLTVIELQHAIAFTLDPGEVDEANLFEEQRFCVRLRWNSNH